MSMFPFFTDLVKALQCLCEYWNMETALPMVKDDFVLWWLDKVYVQQATFYGKIMPAFSVGIIYRQID